MQENLGSVLVSMKKILISILNQDCPTDTSSRQLELEFHAKSHTLVKPCLDIRFFC